MSPPDRQTPLIAPGVEESRTNADTTGTISINSRHSRARQQEASTAVRRPLLEFPQPFGSGEATS